MKWKFIIINELIQDYADSEELRHLFSEILKLRFTGYRQYYGQQSIPQDCYDFIGTHLVIASEHENNLIPRLVLRSITNKQAQTYNKDFPFLEHMFEKGNESLKMKCKMFIDSQDTVCYTNNYTIDPNLSDDLKKQLAQMILGFYYLYHCENNINSFITAASDKYKVYNTRLKQGYQYIGDDSNFATFCAPHIMNEKFRAMVMTEFSLESRRLAREFQHYYDDKILYNADLKIAA